MTRPLVETKLFVPYQRGHAVQRPRLTQLLNPERSARLILVSAPAGFGKTTLLTRWLAMPARHRATSWLSLEETDNQPVRFWTYLVAAVRRALPAVGAGSLALLETRQPPLDSAIATLINELTATGDELDLVLDDYHVVDSSTIQQGVAFLLEHLPPQVRLIISTRVDPALPLARLRARGDLVEIRAADLRFTLPEVAVYLNDIAGVALTSSDVATLESRTEGWIAALQLAALSLRGCVDAAAFIAAFAGDDRYIVDYLVDEVLTRQPLQIRDFLLQTSILDRLSGPLCEAVTGRTDSQDLLEHLDRSNLFLVALDGTRRWFRYHHLFAEVLLTHLLAQGRVEIDDLHRRASHWYDQAGEPDAAVRHAAAAGDLDRAADLAERALPILQRNRQEATIAGWLSVIPDEVVQARPVLALGFIAALMSNGQFETVEKRLDDLERHLTGPRGAGRPGGPPPGMIPVDPNEWERLPAALQLYRSALSLVLDDPTAAIVHADLATARAAENDHLTRAGAAAVAGLARWTYGELEEAHRCYTVSVDGLRRAGHISDVLGCSITLADIRITQGRLADALQTYHAALLLAQDDPGSITRGTADMHVGISQVAYERNELDAAEHHLQLSAQLGDGAGLPQNQYRRRVAHARLLAARGDVPAAIQLLDEAERVYVGDFAPNVRPVPALRARLHLAQADLTSAVAWARAHEFGADDQITYLHEYDHLTLAMLLLAQHRAGDAARRVLQATALLDRLLAAAASGGRDGTCIDILVQLALASEAIGDQSQAAAHLGRALSLAERDGHIRIFLDAGPSLVPMLHRLATTAPEARVARTVLVAAGNLPASAGVFTEGLQTVAEPVLIEPLSDRELEVLRLLDSDLGGPAIARELSVSVNTVRTHTRHIYAKLGATNRREAVRRAARLGLLRRTHR